MSQEINIDITPPDVDVTIGIIDSAPPLIVTLESNAIIYSNTPESRQVSINPPVGGINATNVGDALTELADIGDLVVLIENRLV
jgi:hypothetical protein